MEPRTSQSPMTRRHALRAAIGVAAAVAVLGVNPSPSAAAAPKPLPVPAPVTVSELTAQSFKLGIGTSTSKLYTIYLNGRILAAVAQSTQTIKVPITGLTQNTTYTVQVEEVVPSQGFRTSPRTAPLAVRTPAYVAPVLPAAPTNLLASNAMADSVRLSWTAVSGAVAYRVYANGVAQAPTTSSTSFVLGPTAGYPNPIANRDLRSGRTNRLAVESINAAGVASRLAETTVTLPGVAAAAPTAPPNLALFGRTNNTISVSFSPSTDAVSTETQLSYLLYLDGRYVGFTCSQYCFGTTGGSAVGLAPGTTYRIGIAAVNGSGIISDRVEITATTTTP